MTRVIATLVLFLAPFLSLCVTLPAQTVEYDEKLFELVDWQAFSNEVAFGNANNVPVSLDVSIFETPEIFSFDGYADDEGFDNLNFLGSDTFETIRFKGGFAGVSTFESESPIGELLMLIGSPGDGDAPSQYGPSLWCFDNSLSLEIVDAEIVPEGTITIKDNLLDNTAANITSSPESFHMSCVIRIFGNEFNQLNIIQLDSPGQDLVNVSFAIPVEKLLGDVNMDGIVDLLDVNPFVNILTNGGFVCEADINQDGVVDLLDVDPFVDLLIGS